MRTLVERVEASPGARERARVILLTLGRKWTVQEACQWLGIQRTRFQDLRRRLLEGAVGALEERAAGRPRQRTDPQEPRLSGLRQKVAKLEHELCCAQTELDIARSEAGTAVARRRTAKEQRR